MVYIHTIMEQCLTFTENPNMKHKIQKQPKPNIIRTHHYNCAYVRLMVVLIIFPVILQNPMFQTS